ncbi:MAG: hypothetical protein ACE5F1_20685 [Planctomycetota bacterium]
MDSEFLYTNGLTTGLGSNPVGLDRRRFGRVLGLRGHWFPRHQSRYAERH